MIHLNHSVTGGQIGAELANDEEELAYALVAIAEAGPSDTEIADHLHGSDREAVRDFCNALAITLADD
ncbi:hypothetical protein [Roseovarius indicus]|uniref:Uncharacterized protein n=1 Tax=Roseovarius indicus TaxID=540747 RepID=A0A0T5P376_9RHOB|nr:hypothetical protein [Roseovarius indicus]KRS15633.1 hypothetical protein XM52_22595 [Roseovarius indicus]QEW27861.1 hypothetical protein RIdsm_03682 [Roseovarius indicus]SFE79073.1 hypothetical protein SAMN04488031_1225 [Roseovarius indicus]